MDRPLAQHLRARGLHGMPDRGRHTPGPVVLALLELLLPAVRAGGGQPCAPQEVTGGLSSLAVSSGVRNKGRSCLVYFLFLPCGCACL